MGHSVGKAAENAVNRSAPKKAKEERSVEEVIKDIRNNLAAKLAVTPEDVRALLAEYDKVVTGTGAYRPVFPVE